MANNLIPRPCANPPPLSSKRPCLVSVGARDSILSILSIFQIFFEGWILRLSCVFAGWTRYCCWFIAVYFKFLAWKALHCTLYHAEHSVFRNFSHECR